MKFAHIADTHIRNLKYDKEYREVFSQLYEKLREERPDYIIHCGDIAHTKTQISPEFVDLCSSFFKKKSGSFLINLMLCIFFLFFNYSYG